MILRSVQHSIRLRLPAVLCAVAVGFAAWMLPFTQGLAFFSYDLPFAFRSEPKPNEALIVYMDDDSRKQLKQPVQGPWDRELHIKLLKVLTDHHARAVVFDLLFDEPWPKPGVDEQFAAAIKTHGSVVLGASCQYSSPMGEPIIGRVSQPIESLAFAATWGVAELPLDNDGVIRRQFYDDRYTNLSWQAAVVSNEALRDRAEPKWINFYGPSGFIPHVSYHQLLQPGAVPVELISNKVVFVGMAPIINYQGSHSKDEFRTAVTRWTGANYPGVEIQATAFLNLVRGESITRLPFLLELGLIMLGAVCLAFSVSVQRGPVAFGTAGAIAFLTAALGVASVLTFNLWFNWAVVSFTQAPLALLWVARHRSQKMQENIPAEPRQPPGPPIEPEGPPSIPDHIMLRKVGEGSYGQVWLAKNTSLGAHRAVKLVFRSAFTDRTPFDRELQGIQNFEPISRSHEGFVDILQVGIREGYFFYVMEAADSVQSGFEENPDLYVPKTLSKTLSACGTIPCAECVRIGLKLAEALHELHKCGLIHRDIKPSNIVFVDNTPKLADVGLVTSTQTAGSFVGTEGFIPPEGPGTVQADIYSLGKVLYEISMGRDRKLFPELPTNFPENPEREQVLELDKIIQKACAGNRRHRYQSADKMAKALKALAKKLESKARPA